MTDRPAWRTMHEVEADYVRDLASRWQSYAWVAGGVGLILGLIAASMRGAVIHGIAMVAPAVAYGLGTALIGAGVLLAAVLLAVARRIQRDLDAARVDGLKAPVRVETGARYVRLDAAGERFLLRRDDWERLHLPPGDLPDSRLEFTPLTRVVLAVDGRPVFGGENGRG